MANKWGLSKIKDMGICRQLFLFALNFTLTPFICANKFAPPPAMLAAQQPGPIGAFSIPRIAYLPL